MACLHLFGSGDVLPEAVKVAIESGWQCIVRTSPRLFDGNLFLSKKLQNLNVEVIVDSDLSAAMRRGIPQRQGDIALSFGAPWIFKSEWIDSWNGRIFNNHCRRLPEHRGAGGASWLIMMGDKQGRATIHQVTHLVDQGPIVASQDFDYPIAARLPIDYDSEDTRQSTNLICQWLPKAFKGQIDIREQNEVDSTYWPRLSTDRHGWLDWNWNIDEIVAFANAFSTPYKGVSSFLQSERVFLNDFQKESKENFHPFQRGLIFRVYNGRYFVACRDGAITIGKVSAPITLRPRVGDRFVTPMNYLEEALSTRVTYKPNGDVETTLTVPLG